MALRAGIVAVVLLLFAAPVAGAADPLRARQWGLDMIHADAAHAISTGSGAVVAVVDTGVKADHPDLSGQTLPGHDFVDNGGSSAACARLTGSGRRVLAHRRGSLRLQVAVRCPGITPKNTHVACVSG